MDQLLVGHENFLRTVTSRTLLDEDSREIRDQLRCIHESMLHFSHVQQLLFNSAIAELERRKVTRPIRFFYATATFGIRHESEAQLMLTTRFLHCQCSSTTPGRPSTRFCPASRPNSAPTAPPIKYDVLLLHSIGHRCWYMGVSLDYRTFFL